MSRDGLTAEAADEVESLRAIFDDRFCELFAGTYTLKVDPDGAPSTCLLQWVYPPDYPQRSPPSVQVSASWLADSQVRCLVEEQLMSMFRESVGDVIVYRWAMWLQQDLVPFLHSLGLDRDLPPAIRPSAPVLAPPSAAAPSAPAPAPPDVPIVSGPPYTDRRSRFQAHVARVRTLADVQQVARQLRHAPRTRDATHNILAFRVPGDQGYDDDGESGAGEKLLFLLQHAAAECVAVVVSRWFGGILLGADRFRIIVHVAKAALEAQGVIGPQRTPAAGVAAAAAAPEPLAVARAAGRGRRARTAADVLFRLRAAAAAEEEAEDGDGALAARVQLVVRRDGGGSNTVALHAFEGAAGDVLQVQCGGAVVWDAAAGVDTLDALWRRPAR